MQDEDHCRVVESFMGKPFPSKEDPEGPMYWKMTRLQGGRKYVRDTWLVPPWEAADESYAKSHGIWAPPETSREVLNVLWVLGRFL